MTSKQRKKLSQIADVLDNLSEDMKLVSSIIVDNKLTDKIMLTKLADDVRDMASLLRNEMSFSDVAYHHASELDGVGEILREWAARPTDRTGADGRAAQLTGAANCVESWALELRK